MQFARACATAWAKDNIQVNSVLPGWIDTELTKGARREVQGLHERVLARTPAGRWGDPKDFAGIAVFLSSAASDFVTGTRIPVDGGLFGAGLALPLLVSQPPHEFLEQLARPSRAAMAAAAARAASSSARRRSRSIRMTALSSPP